MNEFLHVRHASLHKNAAVHLGRVERPVGDADEPDFVELLRLFVVLTAILEQGVKGLWNNKGSISEGRV